MPEIKAIIIQVIVLYCYLYYLRKLWNQWFLHFTVVKIISDRATWNGVTFHRWKKLFIFRLLQISVTTKTKKTDIQNQVSNVLWLSFPMLIVNYDQLYVILNSTEIKLYLIINFIFNCERSIVVYDIFLNFNHNIHLIVRHKFISRSFYFTVKNKAIHFIQIINANLSENSISSYLASRW